MDNVRVCIVGAGRAGMVHATNFRDRIADAEVVGVVDADLARAQERAKVLGADWAFGSIESAVAEAEFDAVCIAAPTFIHAPAAIAAARAGKHVLCEKPMALTLEEADGMIAAADETGVVLQIAFMRRFDPAFREAKAQIESGAIGRPMVIRSVSRGPGLPPRWACDPSTSIGMLAEVNSHDFDTVRWLAGSEYARVYAEAATFKVPELKAEFPDFYDTAILTATMANGTLAIIDGACPAGYGYDGRAEVLGTEGVLLIGEMQEHALVRCTRDDGIVSKQFRAWAKRFEAGYLGEDEHFIHCIRSGEQPLVTGEDGRQALAAALAATRSIQTGAPVELS